MKKNKSNNLFFYKKVRSWLNSKSKPRQMLHFDRTAYWAKKLKPDIDEAMLIAALAHDVERVFRTKDFSSLKKNPRSADFLKYHQVEGSRLVGDFLISQGASSIFVKKVKDLVEHHEIGGGKNRNIIKDSDSISFFENNIDHFMKNWMKDFGSEYIRNKIEWMYRRISSKKAKNFAKTSYVNSIKKLEGHEKN